MFNLFKKKEKDMRTSEEKIIDWIAEARGLGFSDEQIAKRLMDKYPIKYIHYLLQLNAKQEVKMPKKVEYEEENDEELDEETDTEDQEEDDEEKEEEKPKKKNKQEKAEPKVTVEQVLTNHETRVAKLEGVVASLLYRLG